MSEAVCDLQKLVGGADEGIVDACADTGGGMKVELVALVAEESWWGVCKVE